MGKIDLKDVSFLIPVRIDSHERFENANWIIEFLKKNFYTTVTVLEADKCEKLLNPLIDNKIFIKDFDKIFHRTRYLNMMTKESITEFVAIWDADVIVDYIQITEAVKILREEKIEVVFPYDGRFYRVPQIIRKIYRETKDISLLAINQKKFLLYYWQNFVGGAFIVNRNAYIESGMENENFYGWGPEDEERLKRWEILSLKLKRVQGPMFHFDHPRNNSWFASKELERQNRKELIKVCNMDKKTLLLYFELIKLRMETPISNGHSLQYLTDSLMLNASFIGNPGMLHGKMGISIFFYHLARQTGNQIYEDYAGELIDEIYEEITANMIYRFINPLKMIFN